VSPIRTTRPVTLSATDFVALEAFLSPARWNRYRIEAGGNNDELAFRLYRWNCQLSESFLTPLNYVEVGLRNRIVPALDARFGANWPLQAHTPNLSALPSGARKKIAEAAEQVRWLRRPVTRDRVIAALMFGFWCKMLTSRYDRILWSAGIHHHFPHLPPTETIRTLQSRMDELCAFRNRIGHHEPIIFFRTDPQANPRLLFEKTMEAIGWICPTTQSLVAAIEDVSTVIKHRPR